MIEGGDRLEQFGIFWVRKLDVYRCHEQFYRDKGLHCISAEFLEKLAAPGGIDPGIPKEGRGIMTVFDATWWLRERGEPSGM